MTFDDFLGESLDNFTKGLDTSYNDFMGVLTDLQNAVSARTHGNVTVKVSEVATTTEGSIYDLLVQKVGGFQPQTQRVASFQIGSSGYPILVGDRIGNTLESVRELTSKIQLTDYIARQLKNSSSPLVVAVAYFSRKSGA